MELRIGADMCVGVVSPFRGFVVADVSGAAPRSAVADGPPAAMVLLPDGRAVTCDARGSVRVWELVAGDAGVRRVAGVRELGRHDGEVLAMAAMADGRVVTAGGDRRVLIWDPDRPSEPPQRVGGADELVRVLFPLSSGELLTGGDAGGMRVHRRSGVFRLVGVGSRDRVVAAVRLPDGAVAVGQDDGQVRLVISGRRGRTSVAACPRPIRAMAVHADGRVVVADPDGRVLVKDPFELLTRWRELVDHGSAVRAILPLPDGRLATLGDDRRLLVWSDPEVYRSPSLPSSVSAMTALPGGRLASGDDAGRVVVWDLTRPGGQPTLLGTHDDVKAMATLGDGRIVTAGHTEILLWDPGRPGTRTSLWDVTMPSVKPLEFGLDNTVGGVLAIGVLPDGRIVTGTRKGHVLIWDPAHPGSRAVVIGRHGGSYVGNVTSTLPGKGTMSGTVVDWSPAEVQALAVTPDGAVVTGGADGRLLLWEPYRRDTGSRPLGPPADAIRAAAALPDGRIVTAGQFGALVLWDPNRPDAVQTLADFGSSVLAVAALPDGSVVLPNAIDGSLLVYDPARPGSLPREVGRLRSDEFVRALATLPEGQVAVVDHPPDDAPAIRVWDTRPRSPVQQVDNVYAAAIEHTGQGTVALVVLHGHHRIAVQTIDQAEHLNSG